MKEEIAVLATANVILRVSYGSNMRREMAKIVWGGNSCDLNMQNRNCETSYCNISKKTNRYCKRREIKYKHNVNKMT
jgi:hypothetical protein